jgi:hypothetical protein
MMGMCGPTRNPMASIFSMVSASDESSSSSSSSSSQKERNSENQVENTMTEELKFPNPHIMSKNQPKGHSVDDHSSLIVILFDV